MDRARRPHVARSAKTAIPYGKLLIETAAHLHGVHGGSPEEGGITIELRVQRVQVPWGSGSLRVLSVRQADLGMEIDVTPGDQANVYCSTHSLKLVAALFDACSEDGGVAMLHRHRSAGADLVIFRGTDAPLSFPECRRLHDSLQRNHTAQFVRLGMRPEMSADRSNALWKQRSQITVRTQDHLVLLGGTSYGLRLCALTCMALAEPGGTDHYHLDHWWLGTSKTVELIIRNVDREQ